MVFNRKHLIINDQATYNLFIFLKKTIYEIIGAIYEDNQPDTERKEKNKWDKYNKAQKLLNSKISSPVVTILTVIVY